MKKKINYLYPKVKLRGFILFFNAPKSVNKYVLIRIVSECIPNTLQYEVFHFIS